MTGTQSPDSITTEESSSGISAILMFTLTGKRRREMDDSPMSESTWALARHYGNDSDKQGHILTNSLPDPNVKVSTNTNISDSKNEESPKFSNCLLDQTPEPRGKIDMSHLSIEELRKLSQTTKSESLARVAVHKLRNRISAKRSQKRRNEDFNKLKERIHALELEISDKREKLRRIESLEFTLVQSLKHKRHSRLTLSRNI